MLPCAAAAWLALVRPRKAGPKTISLFVVAGTLLLMSLMIRRFVEYAAPMMLFFLASYFTDGSTGSICARRWRSGAGEAPAPQPRWASSA